MVMASSVNGLLASALAIVVTGSPATAGLSAAYSRDAGGRSLVETVQSYHRDCGWKSNGWFYQRGGANVACRPKNPGRGYVWHREGERFGWYHRGDKRWHHNNW